MQPCATQDGELLCLARPPPSLPPYPPSGQAPSAPVLLAAVTRAELHPPHPFAVGAAPATQQRRRRRLRALRDCAHPPHAIARIPARADASPANSSSSPSVCAAAAGVLPRHPAPLPCRRAAVSGSSCPPSVLPMEAWATPPAAAVRACLHFVIAAKPSRVRPDGRSTVPPPWRGARLGGASHAALRQRRIRSRRHTGRYRRGWTPRFQGTSMASMAKAEPGGHTSTVCRNARAYGLADYLDASLPTKMVAFASRLRGGDKLAWVSEKRKKIVLGPAVVALDDYNINEVTSSCKVSRTSMPPSP